MDEIGRDGLIEYIDMLVALSGTEKLEAYDQLVNLIEDSDNPFKMLKRMGFKPDYSQANKDSKAYDERIDEIVEHYRRQDEKMKKFLSSEEWKKFKEYEIPIEPCFVEDSESKVVDEVDEKLADAVFDSKFEAFSRGRLEGQKEAEQLLSQKRVVTRKVLHGHIAIQYGWNNDKRQPMNYGQILEMFEVLLPVFGIEVVK